MKRVYIAGPMSGLPEFNYPAFHAAEDRLRAVGVEPLNPAEAVAPTTPKPWDWYMRRALRLLTQADGIALLPGWEASRGATLEHHVGGALGLDIRPISEWTEAGA